MYVFDKEAIDEARHELGIKWPIRVWWRQMYTAAGRYCHGYRGDHLITVSTRHRNRPSYLSEIIWHELGHARQHEEWGGARFMMDEYYRQLEEVGIPRNALSYNKTIDVSCIPMEQECYALEVKAKDFPLVKFEKKKPLTAVKLDVSELIEGI